MNFVVYRHLLCNDDVSWVLVDLLVAADVSESKLDHTDADVHHEAGHEEMHHETTERILRQNFSALLRDFLGVLQEATGDEERMVVLRAELYTVFVAHHFHLAHAVGAMVGAVVGPMVPFVFFNFSIFGARWGWAEKLGEVRGWRRVFLILSIFGAWWWSESEFTKESMVVEVVAVVVVAIMVTESTMTIVVE